MIKTKRCCHCKEIKIIKDFNKNKSTKDKFAHACRLCGKKQNNEYSRRNREKLRQKAKIYYYENLEKVRLNKREYAKKNRKAELKRAKDWYQENKKRKYEYDKKYAEANRDKRRLASRKFKKRHPSNSKVWCAIRRASKLKAMPTWVDKNELKNIYKNCPSGYHVDHIIPLISKTVCGLHVPWNLQYLLPIENLKKANHYDPYSYGE